MIESEDEEFFGLGVRDNGLQIVNQKISTQVMYFTVVLVAASLSLKPFNISGASNAVLLPSTFVVLVTVLYKNGKLLKIAVPIGVFVINVHTYAENLGDQAWLSVIANSDPEEIWLSSLGGHAALQITSEFPTLIQYLPPVLGTLSSALIIFATRVKSSQNVHWIGIASATLVGTLPMFSRGYVEVIPYSVPVAILAIIFIQDLVSADNKRYGFAAGLVSMLAFLMHGIFLLLVAFLFFAVLTDTRQKDFRKINQVVYGSLVALVSFTLLIISTGKTVVPGDAF